VQPTEIDQNFNSLYLRHDLLIELDRLESAIESWRSPPAPNQSMDPHHAQVSDVLKRLGFPSPETRAASPLQLFSWK
jgi:hypothetical protein